MGLLDTPPTRDLTLMPGTSPVPSGTINRLQDIAVSLQTNQSEGAFGPGTDGDVVLDGVVAAPAWCTKVGTVYTMTRDAFPNNLTLTGAGVVLVRAGFRPYVRKQFQTIGGAYLDASGGAATSGLAGAAYNLAGVGAPAGTVGGGTTGGNSNNTIGTNGTNVGAPSFSGAGGNGGTSLSAGGVGGTVTAPGPTDGRPEVCLGALMGALVSKNGVQWLKGGASGADGGGGGGTNVGGAPGGGAGVGCLAARKIVLENANDIRCRGGNGGLTTYAGCGGGGGGGGGTEIIVYQQLTVGVGVLNAATVCAGGVQGVGNAEAPPATPGAVGTLFLIKIAVDFVLNSTAPASVPTMLPATYFEPLPDPANFPINSVIVNRTTNEILITYDQLNWTALS
jgi:hypothetical protein